MLLAVLASASSDVTAQSLTLDYQQVVVRAVPGATAAMSLDSSRVTASVQDGVVTLVGRSSGSTNVIVITGTDTVTLSVLVGEPPVTVLPGLRGSARNGSSGYYEARYGSEPRILQGILSVSRRDGDRTAELMLGGATPFAADHGSPFSIPQASFSLRSPDREVTLFDRRISNSPLTISRSNVRGVYLREGPWQLNAGYSFFGTFEQLLLPTQKEAVAGVAYHHRLSANSTLTPNLFFFDTPASSGRGGALGSLVYETQTARNVKLLAEVGIGRSPGGAFEVELDQPNNRAWVKTRLAPPGLPALTTDRQSGRQVEGGWIWQGKKSGVNATVASRQFDQGQIDQTSSVASIDVSRRLTDRWSIHGGSGASFFKNAAQADAPISSITMPVGTSFAGRNLGAGFDYHFSRETTRDLGGHLLRANLNASAGGFRVSAFGERETEAPTARQIYTDVPWLQPMLDRLGLSASTPTQIADLLKTNAELAAFGYASQISVDLAPVRTRLGANGGWMGSGAHRPQLSLNTLVNRDHLVAGTSVAAMHSLSYSQRLDAATELYFTGSGLCTGAMFSSCRPVVFGSMRRSLDSAPGVLGPHGSIAGVVFKDDAVQGFYTPGMPLMAGVEIVLDGTRSTTTDSAGRFHFEGVSSGRHRVEARYASKQPTFFTTPSPVDAEIGSSVQFGIALARSSLRGVVVADAGGGVSDVLVRIAGSDYQTTVRTADDGTFAADGLPAGDYDVNLQAGSLPVGYPAVYLESQHVQVAENAPGRARFVLRPYRSIAGRARQFNREAGQYVALANAMVEILPLGQQSVTDASGQYAFRNLPAGDYTVAVNLDGYEKRVAVHVPEGPVLMKDVDLAIVPSATPVVASASPIVESASYPARSSAQASAVADGDTFTIEIARAANVRFARAMVDELKSAGHAAYLEPTPADSGRTYRVRVGRFPSQAQADASARSLGKTLGWRVSVTPLEP